MESLWVGYFCNICDGRVPVILNVYYDISSVCQYILTFMKNTQTYTYFYCMLWRTENNLNDLAVIKVLLKNLQCGTVYCWYREVCSSVLYSVQKWIIGATGDFYPKFDGIKTHDSQKWYTVFNLQQHNIG